MKQTYTMVYICRNCGARVSVELKRGEECDNMPYLLRDATGREICCAYCGSTSLGSPRRPEEQWPEGGR